jgi:hypothetical protein
MTEDIFIAEILGHKLLPGATAPLRRAELQGFLCRRGLKFSDKAFLANRSQTQFQWTLEEEDYQIAIRRIQESEKDRSG